MKLSIDDLKKYLVIAKEAATTAGQYLQKASESKLRIIAEPDRDIKLKADIDSEKIIIDILKSKSNFLFWLKKRVL